MTSCAARLQPTHFVQTPSGASTMSVVLASAQCGLSACKLGAQNPFITRRLGAPFCQPFACTQSVPFLCLGIFVLCACRRRRRCCCCFLFLFCSNNTTATSYSSNPLFRPDCHYSSSSKRALALASRSNQANRVCRIQFLASFTGATFHLN